MKLEDNVFSKEYQISRGTEDIKSKEEVEEIKIDSAKYQISKPKRVLIRARIIHDQG